MVANWVTAYTHLTFLFLPREMKITTLVSLQMRIHMRIQMLKHKTFSHAFLKLGLAILSWDWIVSSLELDLECVVKFKHIKLWCNIKCNEPILSYLSYTTFYQNATNGYEWTGYCNTVITIRTKKNAILNNLYMILKVRASNGHLFGQMTKY